LIVRLWRSLPVILRAIIVGELVVSIGGVPPELAIVANLRTSPHLPWLLVVTAIWLWLFWWYLGGRGWPTRTAEMRRRDLRGGPVPGRVWIWALIAAALGILSTLGLAATIARLANVPHEAFKAPVNLYGLVGSFSVTPVWITGFDANFTFCIALMLVFGVAAAASFVRLASVALREPNALGRDAQPGSN
jgi:hypothetical protein